MGTYIKIEGANYTNNVKTIFEYQISDNAQLISHTPSALSVKNNGPTSNYEFVAVKNLTSKYSITTPVATGSPAGNAVVIGLDVNGNAIVMYLESSGTLYRFPKTWVTGTSQNTLLRALPVGSRPNIAKGSPVTLTWDSDSLLIEYAGFTYDMPLSFMPEIVTKALGVLVTTNNVVTYPFVRV